jgi:hypothetical protein
VCSLWLECCARSSGLHVWRESGLPLTADQAVALIDDQ